jgi:hypothetical protein
MFNHLRALLFNRDGGPPAAGVPYDEFIPAEYKAVALPGFVADIRAVLFGRTPDRWMLAWRTHQLICAIRASDLARYEATFDTRKLYLGDAPTTTPPTRFLEELSNFNTWPVVLGKPTSPDDSGRMRRTFDLSVASGIVTLHEPFGTASGTFALSAGPVPLADTGFSVTALADPDAGSVTITRRPTRSFGDLLGICASLALERLFLSAAFSDAYAAFKKAFDEGSVADKMAAVALAVAWQTEEKRRGA